MKLGNKLQNVQNAAAKLILKRKKFESASIALHELHWLPIVKRIDFKVLVLAYKVYHFSTPAYFSNKIRKKVSLRSTRSSSLSLLECENDLMKPKLKSCGERSFYFYCVKIWNLLPENIRLIPTLNGFKAQLKTYLFSR